MIKEPVLYFQNKRLAQTISKKYGINYDVSLKIVLLVCSETIWAIKEANKDGEV